MRNIVKLVNVALVGLLVLTAPMGAAEINFEGLPAGTVVFQVSTGSRSLGSIRHLVPGRTRQSSLIPPTQPGEILISVRRTKLSVGPESGSEERWVSLSRTARPCSISS